MNQPKSHHELAKAAFRVVGDSLNPEDWTSYFGIQPDWSGIKGTPRPPRYTWRTGIWSFASHIVSDDLEPHILKLVEALKLPRLDLAEKLHTNGLWGDVFCYWENYTGDRVPIVSDALMAALDNSGLKLEIDEYPQQVMFCQNGEPSKVWI